ncbi:MAG TPA: hypothetical protein VN066_03325 [Rhodocyclaceae bacterium]|jgi:hypothetical protein|nr:hypothetical protein [Rhodocyclaceae bacterium]
MTERRILILSTQSLSVWQWQHNDARKECDFPVGEEGQADFRHWLESHLDTLFHLLVDLPDEGFHQEVLPHVLGRDRKALLQRKLNQHFFGTPYSLVRSLGREKQGRRDEHFLFAGLTRPQALEPWLTAMDEAGAALVGIHSPALLLQPVLSPAVAAEPRLILITLGSGGLRQSYFEYGQLRFSRLKPLTGGGIEEAAVNIYGEAVRIYQYLIGQRLLARGNKVPVLCLANPAHFDLLRQSCADTEELGFSLGDLLQVARARQLHTLPKDSSTDALMVHLLARQRAPVQFGNDSARLNYRRWHWRRMVLQGTLAALGLAGLFAIAASALVWRNHQRETEAMHATEQTQQHYDTLVRSLPAIPISPDQLRKLIGEWERLQTGTPDLATTLQPVSAALQKNPLLELQSLDWRLAANPDETGTATAPLPPGTTPWIVIDLELQMPASLGPNRRAQNEAVEHFVADLRREPDDNVRVLQQPFDTDSAKSLKGSSEVYAGQEMLRFSIRYARRGKA